MGSLLLENHAGSNPAAERNCNVRFFSGAEFFSELSIWTERTTMNILAEDPYDNRARVGWHIGVQYPMMRQ